MPAKFSIETQLISSRWLIRHGGSRAFHCHTSEPLLVSGLRVGLDFLQVFVTGNRLDLMWRATNISKVAADRVTQTMRR